MEQQKPEPTPPIIIQNNNTNIHHSQPQQQPDKKESGKLSIWVAIISLIGVLSVPIIIHFLPKSDLPTITGSPKSECAELKKQLDEETTELKQIEVLIKSQPEELKLQADKIAHLNNIQSINDKIKFRKCD